MCGICGIVDPVGVKEEVLQQMTSSLAHRGPDDHGICISGAVGFGHRRLSIIDLAGGHQPMSNEDGSVWITFNGEIYNFQEIRKQLVDKYSFKTDSDTEVVLRLYEEEGEDCLNDLRGMFAFAIYDFREKKLFVARDHLGQKPFYYHHEGEKFAFASEIKALLKVDPALRELDCRALYEYLTLRVIAPPRSMFRRVRKLPPGHYLVFQKGKISIHRYWDLRYEPKRTAGFEETLEELEARIQSTVKYHLVSDVPVGAFLSGGMDSSLVVAFMTKHATEPFKTFSGDVPYKSYSEIRHAKLLSDKYQTLHHELEIVPSLIKTLPKVVWHLDEPSDSLSICMYYISELARKHVKVVLGGDGGDELFGGYDRYYGNVLVSYYALLPEFLRRHIFGKLIRLMPEGHWYRSFSHRLKWMHQMSFHQGGERYSQSLSYFYFSDAFKKDLYTKKFTDEVGLFDPEACLKDHFNCVDASEAVDRMLYADNMVRMPDHPVMILDRMTMAHGLEARSPFLDHQLANFCASIPPKFKIRFNKLRYIQVQLAKKHLPPELIKKKKQGFNSPLPYVLKDEFRSLYGVFLSNSRLVEAGLLNSLGIDQILQEHVSQKVDHGNRLWLLLNLEIWYRMYIGNDSTDDIAELMSSSRYCG